MIRVSLIKRRKKIMKTIVLNGISLFVVPNTLLADELGQYTVQLWGHTDGIEGEIFPSQNIDDHGVRVLVEEKVALVSPRLAAMPISVFAGKQEGDKVTFLTSGWIDWLEGERKPCNFVIQDAVLQQKGYRYGRFGSFENVLKRLLMNAEIRKESA